MKSGKKACEKAWKRGRKQSMWGGAVIEEKNEQQLVEMLGTGKIDEVEEESKGRREKKNKEKVDRRGRKRS